jgi:regulator of nucleoside diphosphate kinase
MLHGNPILISDRDYDNLVDMFETLSAAEIKQTQPLEEELLRANIIASDEMPADVVAMNSQVQFIDLDTGKVSKVRLSYPWESDMEKGKLSILSPVGTALIGLGTEQEITWPLPNGKNKRLKVIEVERAL